MPAETAPKLSSSSSLPRAKVAPTVHRPTFEELGLSPGKRARLTRMMYEHGPGGGTLLILPIDQGLEHGPADFFANPDSMDPEYEWRLALEGNFSAIALHVGLARKFMTRYAGRVPLILKINGKTTVPSDAQAFSPLTASVEDAVRLGADAVGYTLYVGSPAQDRDILQLSGVRQECDRFGMPLIIWAYPRGEAIAKKGGKESQYAIEYAARVAQEVGADIVKVNYPLVTEKDKDSPPPYNTMNLSHEEAFQRVVRCAGRTLVLVSGGEKMSDDEMLTKVRSSMAAGATGIIFGRNLWQRHYDEALKMTQKVHAIFREHAQPSP
ncbi:MAG: fructose-bisphosphate aldolase [Euryarchaeota archaeon]|nr:fructose-bisphosphate aldolase [Euryarchaeota archaeon]MDE1835256.1 fructose-bisphosphate aldolase [Euryarchaeota archaeon]MDE1881082.1 fructose-bisphosphate aldolase [Euryarchaeota archaeon]MDE2043552.1 fructose-bisphosphate aldolase [Thermoplasmata archaeon]